MLTLYHAPRSRSSRIIWLLEELAADYLVKITNIPRMDGTGAADPANPHPDKKVPALVDDGALITESIAIVQYRAIAKDGGLKSLTRTELLRRGRGPDLCELQLLR